MGRTSDAGERILAAGAELFGQRSYGSISVAELATEAGVPKGSFYYFFPSKQALALAVIDNHWEKQRAEWVRILTSTGPVTERLRILFVATAEVQRQAVEGTGKVVGCLFGNLALEVSGQDDPVRSRLQDIFDEQVDIVERAIDAGRDTGELAEATSRETAKAIVAQIEGIVLLAKLFNDPSQLDHLWENSLRLLGIEHPKAVA